MVKKKIRKHKSTKRCRTALEIEEEQSRTLYVRLPKTIKDADEVKSLFVGDVKIKLPRQSSRHCFVIFPSIQEKIKNMKEVKEKLVEGKPVLTAPPNPMDLEKKKKPKKIKIPDPVKEAKESNVSKYLFVSNIAPGTKASEIKDAFPGSLTVALLKGLIKGKRQARVKMSAPHLCVHYVKNQSEWPVIGGKKVHIMHSKSKNRSSKKKGAKPLKIYNGESEAKNDAKSSVKDENGKKSSEEEESAESGDSDEEQSAIKEEDDSDEEQSAVKEEDDSNEEQPDVKEEDESADESEEAEEGENSQEE